MAISDGADGGEGRPKKQGTTVPPVKKDPQDPRDILIDQLLEVIVGSSDNTVPINRAFDRICKTVMGNNEVGTQIVISFVKKIALKNNNWLKTILGRLMLEDWCSSDRDVRQIAELFEIALENLARPVVEKPLRDTIIELLATRPMDALDAIWIAPLSDEDKLAVIKEVVKKFTSDC